MIYVGFDVGAKAGIATLTDTAATVIPTPPTERGLWEVVSGLTNRAEQRDVCVVIEQVGGYVAGNKGQAGMGPSMFAFGMSYGRLRMALLAAGLPFAVVTPQTWQRGLKISRRKDEDKYKFKVRLADTARRLFPDIKFSNDLADALLIADYARTRYPRGL